MAPQALSGWILHALGLVFLLFVCRLANEHPVQHAAAQSWPSGLSRMDQSLLN